MAPTQMRVTNKMETIVLIQFGSYLYGTATPESDRDVKGIYLPKARDILLQHVAPVISQKREKAHGEKNTATDIDCEWYSPKKYLSLLAEGQMVALDMLYAPESALLMTSPTWTAIKQLAQHILTKQALSLVRYCKAQAHKYGMKGSRILAAQQVKDFIWNLSKNITWTAIGTSINRTINNHRFL
jgi:predicted nucleotidyltransferase